MSLPTIGYLHIPKCAGTSIWEALGDVYGEGRCCPLRHDGALPGGFAVYAGHFAAARMEGLALERCFTVLRDPFERLVSAYRFLRSHSEAFARSEALDLALKARSLSFEDFCADPGVARSPYFDNPFIRMLTLPALPARWERAPGEHATQGVPGEVDIAAARDTVRRLRMSVFRVGEMDALARALSDWTGEPVSLEQRNVTHRRHIGDVRFEPAAPRDMFEGRSDALRKLPQVARLIGADERLAERLLAAPGAVSARAEPPIAEPEAAPDAPVEPAASEPDATGTPSP